MAVVSFHVVRFENHCVTKNRCVVCDVGGMADPGGMLSAGDGFIVPSSARDVGPTPVSMDEGV